jgi:hypothetical protein
LSRPHEVLGVPPGATAKQVRKAYKRLARQFHPDRNPAAGATARFVAVKAACDEMLRRIEAGLPPDPATGPAPPGASARSARTPRSATPRSSTSRPPPAATVRPSTGARPEPMSWEEEDLRLALSDLWRPATYLMGALVLAVAFWMFVTTMERAAGALAPGGYRPPAVSSPDEAEAEPDLAP